MPSTSQPDSPVSFGYKSAWLAIRPATSDEIVQALQLHHVSPSTWAEGIDAAYRGRVFVTPPLQGWVLAVGSDLLEAGDTTRADRLTPLLETLGRQFAEVQYFGTHRVVEWHAWVQVQQGRMVRKFAYLGEQGVFIWNEGNSTAAETQLDMDFSEDGKFPGEDHVTSLAGLWSIDPTTLDQQDLPPSLGIIGDLPK